MKAKELRTKNGGELENLRTDLDRQRGELTLKIRLGTVNETAKLNLLRKDVARIETILRERVKE